MHFNTLTLSEWQQFERVTIDFHDKLTVLTGANASGKTTLLNLLAMHDDWNVRSLATPRRTRKSGPFRFITRIFDGRERGEDSTIGTLTYSNRKRTELTVPNADSPQYMVQLPTKQPVKCFYIPSHRPIYRYEQLQNIPMAKKTKATAFSEVSTNVKRRYESGRAQSNTMLMKNTLIGWMYQGFVMTNPRTGQEVMTRDEEQAEYFLGFEDVLRKVLPESLGFEGIEIRNNEVVFVCNSGEDDFILEASSGGISSIIDLAWQIYMFSTKENADFTVLIDEAENHLHPTMQRRMLPDFLSAFPNARFIVSTHSPLIVGSVRESNVYVLKYNERRKVESEQLDFRHQALSAAQILDEVLGVSFTMPIWVEKELSRIVAKYAKQDVETLDFNLLRAELSQAGLAGLVPEAIGRVVEQHGD